MTSTQIQPLWNSPLDLPLGWTALAFLYMSNGMLEPPSRDPEGKTGLFRAINGRKPYPASSREDRAQPRVGFQASFVYPIGVHTNCITPDWISQPVRYYSRDVASGGVRDTPPGEATWDKDIALQCAIWGDTSATLRHLFSALGAAPWPDDANIPEGWDQMIAEASAGRSAADAQKIYARWLCHYTSGVDTDRVFHALGLAKCGPDAVKQLLYTTLASRIEHDPACARLSKKGRALRVQHEYALHVSPVGLLVFARVLKNHLACVCPIWNEHPARFYIEQVELACVTYLQAKAELKPKGSPPRDIGGDASGAPGYDTILPGLPDAVTDDDEDVFSVFGSDEDRSDEVAA